VFAIVGAAGFCYSKNKSSSIMYAGILFLTLALYFCNAFFICCPREQPEVIILSKDLYKMGVADDIVFAKEKKSNKIITSENYQEVKAAKEKKLTLKEIIYRKRIKRRGFSGSSCGIQRN
jgi:hypothetical protein